MEIREALAILEQLVIIVTHPDETEHLRAEAQRQWEQAQQDIARHDREFDRREKENNE